MKKFILFLCLFSCSQTDNGERLDFDKIDSTSPIETSIEKSDEIYIAEKNSSVEDLVTTSTVPAQLVTTTSTTLNSVELAVRFQEIIEPYLATNITEINNEDYFVNKYSFKFEEKIYTISYNFETDTSYCNYLDYQYNDPLLNSYNLYIFDLEHSMLNKESIAVTYVCKKDTGYGQDLYYDYIFKVDNQCYIYKSLDLIEYLENKLSEENLHIVNLFLDSQPNSIFLKPIKILYSGRLSNNCEKLSNEISSTKIKLNEGKDFSTQILSERGDRAQTDILMYTPFAYYIEYPYFDINLNPITTCAYNDLNQLVNSNVSSYTDSPEEIYLKVDFSVEFFENINSIEIIKFTLHNYLELYFGQRFGKPDVYEFDIIYILDQDCNVIATPDTPMKLFNSTKQTDLTILSEFVISSLSGWGDFIIEADLLNNVWLPYELKNDGIIFDLTYFHFDYSDNTNFTCNNLIYGYDREWIFHWPTYNWFFPVTFSIPIYEISKIVNLNISLDNIITCTEFSSN